MTKIFILFSTNFPSVNRANAKLKDVSVWMIRVHMATSCAREDGVARQEDEASYNILAAYGYSRIDPDGETEYLRNVGSQLNVDTANRPRFLVIVCHESFKCILYAMY
jgi:hypothetical protein